MIATLDRIVWGSLFMCLKTNIFMPTLYSTLLEIHQMNLIEYVFGVVLNKALHHIVTYIAFV